MQSIEFVTLTGELHDGFVGCSAFGRNFFARPVHNTAFQSVPSAEWLAKYRKQYFGVVIYEKEQHDRPLFIGVVPAEGAHSNNAAIENIHLIKTEKFGIFIDDNTEELRIQNFAGVSVYVKKEQVLLGGAEGLQPVVLGNTLKNLLQELIDILKAGKVNTSIGPQPFMPPTQAKLSGVIDKLSTMLSQVVKTK